MTLMWTDRERPYHPARAPPCQLPGHVERTCHHLDRVRRLNKNSVVCFFKQKKNKSAAARGCQFAAYFSQHIRTVHDMRTECFPRRPSHRSIDVKKNNIIIILKCSRISYKYHFNVGQMRPILKLKV